MRGEKKEKTYFSQEPNNRQLVVEVVAVFDQNIMVLSLRMEIDMQAIPVVLGQIDL